MPSERQYRREIALFGRALHERGYVAAMDGNLSVRLDERHILATPTSMCKGMMKPSDMVIVDMEGRRVEGRRSGLQPAMDRAAHRRGRSHGCRTSLTGDVRCTLLMGVGTAGIGDLLWLLSVRSFLKDRDYAQLSRGQRVKRASWDVAEDCWNCIRGMNGRGTLTISR